MLRSKFKISLLLLMLVATNVAAKKYSMEQIYNKMCIECHSANGSGNTDKLTPSLRDDTQEDIFESLKEVEDDNGHIIMNHNREKILEKGMQYSAKDMAEYMYKRFKK